MNAIDFVRCIWAHCAPRCRRRCGRYEIIISYTTNAHRPRSSDGLKQFVDVRALLVYYMRRYVFALDHHRTDRERSGR